MSTLPKIFTTILTNRLDTWVESHDILPKSQAGFRKRRSCNDNIFCLTAATQIHVQRSKNKVYGIFINFKRAFDSVNHSRLCHNLYSRGINGKLIRILKNIYEKATITVESGSRHSTPIAFTTGVL